MAVDRPTAALDKHMHEVARRRRAGLSLLENGEFVADARGAQVPHAQPDL